MTVTQLVSRLEAVKNSIAVKQASFRALGVTWESDDDMRSRWFDTAFKSTTIVQGHLHVYRDSLSKHTWWCTIAPRLPLKKMDWIRSETTGLYRWVLLHGNYSALEECLRRIADSFDPPFMKHRRSFTAITSRLCDSLNMRKYKRLFRLASLTRNTIHNNGHFRPDFGSKRQQASWGGKTYYYR